MKKLLDKLAAALVFIAVVLLFIIFLVNMLEIAGRSLFNHSFLWVSDLNVISVVWMICLGMAAGVHYREHLFMNLLAEQLPEKMRLGVNIVISLISFAFFVMLFVTGLQTTSAKLDLIFPSTQWSVACAMAAMPVFAFFAAIFMLPRLIELLQGKNANVERPQDAIS